MGHSSGKGYGAQANGLMDIGVKSPFALLLLIEIFFKFVFNDYFSTLFKKTFSERYKNRFVDPFPK